MCCVKPNKCGLFSDKHSRMPSINIYMAGFACRNYNRLYKRLKVWSEKVMRRNRRRGGRIVCGKKAVIELGLRVWIKIIWLKMVPKATDSKCSNAILGPT
jgi:hypothetical protein